jgi:hypothetical protein
MIRIGSIGGVAKLVIDALPLCAAGPHLTSC